MGNGKFIWCRNCGDIHRVTPYDRAPAYTYCSGETAEIPANDWRDFMACHSRSTIEEPVRYEFVNGRLVENALRLEVQEKEIRKEMKLHHSWAPAASLADEKIDLFVALFREVVSALDPRDVRTSEHSDRDDNVSYGPLDGAVAATLLTRCGSHFSPAEMESLRRFIESHRDGSDVMTLVKRRCVTVEQPAP
jgi:hypothetical protein